MELSNGILSISVSSHGAELTSIKRGGREYLWQANPEYWKRSSPVLFPIVGSVWNGEYRSHGSSFKLGQHGFARDMEFAFVKKETDADGNPVVFYSLDSSDATLEKYPYAFHLEIGYRLVANSVEVIWRVANPSDADMFFQIGAHPAFYWPMLSGVSRDDAGLEVMKQMLNDTDLRGFFSFGCNEKVAIVNTALADKGCADVNCHSVIETRPDGLLPLTTDTFNHDALILENGQVNQVTLHDQNGNKYLTLSFDAPLVGLWSPPHKNAPFVCIEPWYGRCDRVNYDGDYENKDWIQKIVAHGLFESRYVITVE
ncbi:MAG: aldose 1-epimerase family protein [Bacteroidales bacterium]|nr:aldose 1-epimerase family protein [Bacteroidales bacterium]